MHLNLFALLHSNLNFHLCEVRKSCSKIPVQVNPNELAPESEFIKYIRNGIFSKKMWKWCQLYMWPRAMETGGNCTLR